MSQIHVLIRDAPPMLRDILEQAISNQPDMRVIPEPAASTPAPPEQAPPDVIVFAMSDESPDKSAHALLVEWPKSQVLMITARGDNVVKYEFLPRGVDLGEMSPDQLVQAIRSAVRPDRKPYVH